MDIKDIRVLTQNRIGADRGSLSPLLFGGLAAEVYLRQYVARLLLSRFDIIFIPTTPHGSLFFHRCPSCSVTAKWFFSYRISPSRCMRDSSLLSALRSTFR